MEDLVVLEKFVILPHTGKYKASVTLGDREYTIAELGRIPAKCKFIALVAQWDFLDFLKQEAQAFPHFHLLMQTEAKDLLARGARIGGVLARGETDNLDI